MGEGAGDERAQKQNPHEAASSLQKTKAQTYLPDLQVLLDLMQASANKFQNANIKEMLSSSQKKKTFKNYSKYLRQSDLKKNLLCATLQLWKKAKNASVYLTWFTVVSASSSLMVSEDPERVVLALK